MHLLRAPIIAAVVLLAGAAMFAPTPAAAGRDDLVDVSIFYEELDAGGDWFEHPRYGYVWSPDVDPYWRPYTRGRWIYTDDYGWFWDSDEPFGWAVYHYGRWGYDEADGWFWVPGRRWGPAWVAWRYGDDYAGWAPLPPGAVWSPELGIVYNDAFHISVRFDPYWLFVRPRYLAYHDAYRFARPRSRTRFIITYTRPAAGFVFVNGRIFCRGIGPRRYRRIAKRSVPWTKVYFYDGDRPYKRRARSKRRSVKVFRPGKKWRYRAKRRKAPLVVHKRSPRRAAWKRRAKEKSWKAKRDRRRERARARTKDVVITGEEPTSKDGLRRKERGAKQDARKTRPEQEARPNAKTEPKSSARRKVVKDRRKRKVKINDKKRPKRETTPAAEVKSATVNERDGGERARSNRRPKVDSKVRRKRKARTNDEVKSKRKARPKRQAKRRGKSDETRRGKRAAKAKSEGKGNRDRNEKETARNQRRN